MKFLFDFFPIILFFIAYKASGGDMFLATGVIIAATAIQVGASWLHQRRVEKLHLITLGLVVVFGGATIYFQDEQFIKWKVSVVNWLFALVFLGSQLIGRRCLVERMMGATISVPKAVWGRLNFSWVAFFTAMGFVNLYVMTHYDSDTWVNFKFYGLLGLTFLFVIGQAFYLTRHIEASEQTNEGG